MVRPLDRAADLPWATAILDEQLGGRMQARRGELVDVLDGGGGMVAEVDSRPVGLVTFVAAERSRRAEILAIAVEPAFRRRGIAQVLLDAAHAALRSTGARSAWLTTTNDNVGAIRLYDRLGYRIVDVRLGALDEIRRTIKPSIPLENDAGIPIRDELELELRL